MPKNAKRRTTDQAVEIRKKSKPVAKFFVPDATAEPEPILQRKLDLKSKTIGVFETQQHSEEAVAQALVLLDREKDYNLIAYLLSFGLMRFLVAVVSQRVSVRTIFLATTVISFIAAHNPSAVIAAQLTSLMMEFVFHENSQISKAALLTLQRIANGNAEQSLLLIQQSQFVKRLVDSMLKEHSRLWHPEENAEAFLLIKAVIGSVKGKIPQNVLAGFLPPIVSLLSLKEPSMNVIATTEILPLMIDNNDEMIPVMVNERIHVLLVDMANNYKWGPWYIKPCRESTFTMLAATVRCLGLIVSSPDPIFTDAVIFTPGFMDAFLAMMKGTMGIKSNAMRALRLSLCFLLANIAGGTKSQVNAVFFNDNREELYEPLFESIDCLSNPIDEEVIHIISNILDKADTDMVRFFLNWKRHKALNVLSFFLDTKQQDTKMALLVLELIRSVIRLDSSYCEKFELFSTSYRLEVLVTEAKSTKVSEQSTELLALFKRLAEDNTENQHRPNGCLRGIVF